MKKRYNFLIKHVHDSPGTKKVNVLKYKGTRIVPDIRMTGLNYGVNIHPSLVYYFVSPALFNLLQDKDIREGIVDNLHIVTLSNKNEYANDNTFFRILLENEIDYNKVKHLVTFVDDITQTHKSKHKVYTIDNV